MPGHVPVDEVLSAGHVRGVVGKEEKGETGHLFGLNEGQISVTFSLRPIQQITHLSEATKRNLARLEVADLLVHVGCLVCVDVSGRKGVDPDFVRDPLRCQTLGQVGDGSFGGVVEDLGERGAVVGLVDDLRAHRRVDDDGSWEALFDPDSAKFSALIYVDRRKGSLCHGACGVEDTVDVDVVNVVEVILVEVDSGLDHRNTCILSRR
jgi:hypothetical protein